MFCFVCCSILISVISVRRLSVQIWCDRKLLTRCHHQLEQNTFNQLHIEFGLTCKLPQKLKNYQEQWQKDALVVKRGSLYTSLPRGSLSNNLSIWSRLSSQGKWQYLFFVQTAKIPIFMFSSKAIIILSWKVIRRMCMWNCNQEDLVL